jgi:hypothetical protein
VVTDGEDANKVLGERRRTVDGEVFGKRQERRRGSDISALLRGMETLRARERERESSMRSFPVGSHPLRAHPVEGSAELMPMPPPNVRRVSAAGTSFYSFAEDSGKEDGR